MSRRRKYVLQILAALSASGLVASLVRVKEPSYAGRALSEWVEDYEKNTEQRAATDDAIQHIGTNALTFLLQWIRYQPSSWRYNLYNAANDALGLLNRNWEIEDREETRAAGAIKAFGALRPQVERAIPEIGAILDDGAAQDGASRAAAVLGRLGNAGLLELLRHLTNQQARLHIGEIASGIRHMGTNGRPAVPTLIGCLKARDDGIAWEAAWTLGELELEADLVVPALADTLQHTNSKIRWVVAVGISHFGKRARPVQPLLLSKVNDPDPEVRFCITNALRAIEGQAPIMTKCSWGYCCGQPSSVMNVGSASAK